MGLSVNELEDMPMGELHGLMDVLPMIQVLGWVPKSPILSEAILQHAQYGKIFDETSIERVSSLMNLLHEMKVFSQDTGISLVQQVPLPGFAQHSSITFSAIISQLSFCIAQMLTKGIKQYLIPTHASAILSAYVVSSAIEIDKLWDRFNAFRDSFQELDEGKRRQIERLLLLAISYPHLVKWNEAPSKHPPKNAPLTLRLKSLYDARPRERLHMYKHGLILAPLESHLKFYRTVTAGHDDGTRTFPISSTDDKRPILAKCAVVDELYSWNGSGKWVSAAPDESIEWLETWVFVVRWLAQTLRHPEALGLLAIGQGDVGWARETINEINGNESKESELPQLEQIQYRQIQIGGKKVFVS